MNEKTFNVMKCFVLYPGELRSSFYYTNTDVTVSFISIVTSAFISSWEMLNSIHQSNVIFFHKLHGCIIIRWMKIMSMLYTNYTGSDGIPLDYANNTAPCAIYQAAFHLLND